MGYNLLRLSSRITHILHRYQVDPSAIDEVLDLIATHDETVTAKRRDGDAERQRRSRANRRPGRVVEQTSQYEMPILSQPVTLKDELATYAGSCQSVDFYLQERRCATRVDRKVINAVCSAIMISQANQIATRAALKELLAETLGKCTEQDLRDWAEIALYRNNTVLRTGSRDELVESVISYAHHLLDLLVDEVRRHIVAADEAPQRAA